MTLTSAASRRVCEALPKLDRMSKSCSRRSITGARMRARRSLCVGSRSLAPTATFNRLSMDGFRRKLDNQVMKATRNTHMYSGYVGSLRASSGAGNGEGGSSKRVKSTIAETASSTIGGETDEIMSGTDILLATLVAAGVTSSVITGAQMFYNERKSEAAPVTEKLDGEPWTERIPSKHLQRLQAAGPSPFPYAYDASLGAEQGKRQYMEDNFAVRDGGRFAAVFDGHGGSGVSTFLRARLYHDFVKFLHEEEAKDGWEPSHSLTSRKNALKKAFGGIEQEVVKIDALKRQGSTAVTVLVHEGEDGDRTLVSANVGDSRAVLSRSGRAIQLTRDHKPNDPIERERISSMGEEIKYDDLAGVYRIRKLGISRSIGDRYAKPVVTGEPEVKRLPIYDDEDEFVILASDGLWDVFTSEQAVKYVHKKLRKRSGDTDSEKRRGLADVVAKEALRRGTMDNVCVAIVWLK